MPIQDRIAEDLKDAMRQRDELRRSTLRSIRSAIHYEEIGWQQPLDDDGAIAVLSRMARQRQESIEEYGHAGRKDLADREEAELAIIRQYLPEQLTQEELVELARRTVAEVDATGPGDMGRVMGKLMPQVRGRAEGSTVSRVVRDILSGLS